MYINTEKKNTLYFGYFCSIIDDLLEFVLKYSSLIFNWQGYDSLSISIHGMYRAQMFRIRLIIFSNEIFFALNILDCKMAIFLIKDIYFT